MKTLRNTLIFILVTSCFGFVNILVEKKAEKFRSASTSTVLDPKSEKIRRVSRDALREVIGGMFNNVTIEQSGKVNIVFKVSGNKRVDVLNVFGYNPQLVSAVTQVVTSTIIMVPEAMEGKYMVAVVF